MHSNTNMEIFYSNITALFSKEIPPFLVSKNGDARNPGEFTLIKIVMKFPLTRPNPHLIYAFNFNQLQYFNLSPSATPFQTGYSQTSLEIIVLCFMVTVISYFKQQAVHSI